MLKIAINRTKIVQKLYKNLIECFLDKNHTIFFHRDILSINKGNEHFIIEKLKNYYQGRKKRKKLMLFIIVIANITA